MTHFLQTTGAIYGTVGEPVLAQDLSDLHIGDLVHFAFTEPITMLEIMVTGELREVYHRIHHSAGETNWEVIILVTGRDCATGDKREFELDQAAQLVFIQD